MQIHQQLYHAGRGLFGIVDHKHVGSRRDLCYFLIAAFGYGAGCAHHLGFAGYLVRKAAYVVPAGNKKGVRLHGVQRCYLGRIYYVNINIVVKYGLYIVEYCLRYALIAGDYYYALSFHMLSSLFILTLHDEEGICISSRYLATVRRDSFMPSALSALAISLSLIGCASLAIRFFIFRYISLRHNSASGATLSFALSKKAAMLSTPRGVEIYLPRIAR